MRLIGIARTAECPHCGHYHFLRCKRSRRGICGQKIREVPVISERIITITRNNDFRRIYSRGKSRVHPLLVTYAMKNRTHEARIAVVSSKKIGGAVQRNRARRVVRAALRMSGVTPVPGWDVVFVCRTRTTTVKSTDIVPVLRRQMGELIPESICTPSVP